MSGILVGVDGSGHSQRALEWAMHEAAVRQVPMRRRIAAAWAGGAAVMLCSRPDRLARSTRTRAKVRGRSTPNGIFIDGAIGRTGARCRRCGRVPKTPRP